MEVLVDREITGAEAIFGALGTVRLFDGRALHRADMGAAEVLLVRSVTRVDAALLADSRVSFVGTATAGCDHLDLAWLRAAGISVADAAGCNARAVAEHVACCLYRHAARTARPVGELRLGIVGYGHVGRAVAALADAIGVAWVANDPPLGRALADVPHGELASLLEASDVVSLHVPLTQVGAYPTAGLIDAAALARMRPGSLLINAARGGVVDEAALVAAVNDRPGIVAALDCWEGEPRVARETLAASWLASPHIAGHTREARLAASVRLAGALGIWAGRELALPASLAGELAVRLDAAGGVLGVLAQAHDLDGHTARMRALGAARGARAASFDADRRDYGVRREFARHAVACHGCNPDTVAELRALGFDCRDGSA
ncbi:MAG: NAD(P)-dependent oxidoreductase [Gammaproteobacteria bacterium]